MLVIEFSLFARILAWTVENWKRWKFMRVKIIFNMNALVRALFIVNVWTIRTMIRLEWNMENVC